MSSSQSGSLLAISVAFVCHFNSKGISLACACCTVTVWLGKVQTCCLGLGTDAIYAQRFPSHSNHPDFSLLGLRCRVALHADFSTEQRGLIRGSQRS